MTLQTYIVLYSLIGLVQGMAHTYLITVLSTIEKQFGIKSQEAAWMFSGTINLNFAQLLQFPTFIFYFAKNLVAFMLIHRLHWMKIYIISTNFFNRKKLNCCRQEMNSVKFASLL